MDDRQEFRKQSIEEIARQGRDKKLSEITNAWTEATIRHKYSYHFEWMGRPIIQNPQDMIAMQQIIWNVKPDLIIETGIARGGSLVFGASMLELISQSGGPENGTILGIDIDIRSHNRTEIEKHPMAGRIKMLEGSSISDEISRQVHEIAADHDKILVVLDSNHTHEHVLKELELYAPLTSVGSYCVVFDTIVNDLPDDLNQDRPWSKARNPKTAVHEYLEQLEGMPPGSPEFVIDKEVENRILITYAPDGYLRRVG